MMRDCNRPMGTQVLRWGNDWRQTVAAAISLRSLYDTFSFRRHRQAPSRRLDTLPNTFRGRAILYWRDFIAPEMSHPGYGPDPKVSWHFMRLQLQHLYGKGYLSTSTNASDPTDDLLDFLSACQTEEFFDFIEQIFKLEGLQSILGKVDDIVDAFNEMFRVDEMPYKVTKLTWREVAIPGQRDQFYDEVAALPQIIVVDDDLIHQEAIEPALGALTAPHFRSANEEFRKALKHYRKGEFPDCLTGCGSTLESTLKVLCHRNGWAHKETDTLNPLLDTVVGKTSLDSFFSQPLMLIGTMRNRLSSAHGKGTQTTQVPAHIAQYAITSTAAAIVLLVKEADH